MARRSIVTLYLTSALNRAKLLTSHFSRSMPGKELRYPLDERLRGCHSQLDVLEKKETFISVRI